MVKLNVNKEQNNDPSYRYKMSEATLKYEGQGNGQKTIFLNITDIAKELNRDPDLILLYLVSAIGCKCVTTKENQIVLCGTHTKDIIQNYIYNFISSFVLCQHCKNPETYYIMEGNTDVCMKCNACPLISKIQLNKINTKIIKQISLKIMDNEKKKKSEKNAI
jgi:translation initiation factor 5